MKTAGIILAAGLSRRMGQENKLLKHWHGKPLITHICESAIGSKCDPVMVVTGHQREEVETALQSMSVQFVYNEEFQQGISSTIRAGVKSAASLDCTSALILLADMPHISTKMIDAVVEAAHSNPGKIIAAANNSKRANPVCWPREYFQKLQNLEGDIGAREILKSAEEEIILIETGSASRIDFDVPGAFVDD